MHRYYWVFHLYHLYNITFITWLYELIIEIKMKINFFSFFEIYFFFCICHIQILRIMIESHKFIDYKFTSFFKKYFIWANALFSYLWNSSFIDIQTGHLSNMSKIFRINDEFFNEFLTIFMQKKFFLIIL